MDQIMVDVKDARVRIADEVVLIGSQKSQRISAESLAALSATIPYEIVCGIGSRVARIYVGKSIGQSDVLGCSRTEEKRRVSRHALSVPVRFLDTPLLADTVAFTEDISKTGLKLSTSDQIMPYRQFNLCLDARNKKPLHVSGTSVWSRPWSNGRYICGIKLDRVLPKEVF